MEAEISLVTAKRRARNRRTLSRRGTKGRPLGTRIIPPTGGIDSGISAIPVTVPGLAPGGHLNPCRGSFYEGLRQTGPAHPRGEAQAYRLELPPPAGAINLTPAPRADRCDGLARQEREHRVGTLGTGFRGCDLGRLIPLAVWALVRGLA